MALLGHNYLRHQILDVTKIHDVIDDMIIENWTKHKYFNRIAWYKHIWYQVTSGGYAKHKRLTTGLLVILKPDIYHSYGQWNDSVVPIKRRV